MSRNTKILLFTGLLMALVVGCDRLNDTPSSNQSPTVRFVNFPVDSTEFSYAPIIYWQGFDPDGFVTGFEYYDDVSEEALNAYRAGDAAFQAYLNTIADANIWTLTEEASEQIYLLTEVGEVTEHIFLVRSVDNLGAKSTIAARTFFRSNQPPNTPQLRWAESTSTDYDTVVAIADTQLVGDTLTITYNGLRLLWQGSDPDSRTSNVIPLQFSYALVNGQGDSIALPVRNDSNHVVGYRAGWSNWGNETQIAFYGLESGNYTFYVRVRDDGFTLANNMAHATFTVVKPQLTGQLLIVNENRPPSALELNRGGIDADTLKAFYLGVNGTGGVLRDAIDIANTLAPIAQPPGSPPIRHFDFDSIAWLDNVDGDVLSYEYISQFAVVWIIDDDNSSPGRTAAEATAYTKVLADYMNVGGNVMYTGRRLFNKSLNRAVGTAPNDFLREYFNIFAIRSKAVYSNNVVNSGIADFVGAVAGDPQYPDLNIDSNMVSKLRYLNQGVTYPPEIEYFGRSNAPVNFDFAITLYNYKSSTADTSLYTNLVENYDCAVDTNWSNETTVALIPLDETLPLLSASTIRNVSRGVNGEFMHVRNISSNLLQPKWRIFASIPVGGGEWTTADTLEVTYRFIPLSADHDEPIALNFIKYDGTIEIIQVGETIRTRIFATPRFRSCFFTFPLSYMKNELYTHPILGDVPAVSLLIANELLFFNQNLDFSFN